MCINSISETNDFTKEFLNITVTGVNCLKCIFTSVMHFQAELYFSIVRDACKLKLNLSTGCLKEIGNIAIIIARIIGLFVSCVLFYSLFL